MNYEKNRDETRMKDHVFAKTYEKTSKSILEETIVMNREKNQDETKMKDPWLPKTYQNLWKSILEEATRMNREKNRDETGMKGVRNYEKNGKSTSSLDRDETGMIAEIILVTAMMQKWKIHFFVLSS